MRCAGRQPRGYILVLTLGVLVLASAALVSVGRLSVERAARAMQAQRDLQRRVGIASCQRAVLAGAERILMRQEVQRRAPVWHHRAPVRFGGYTFDLVISDEQAKADINALLAGSAPAVVENRIRQALSGTGLMSTVALRPRVESDRTFVGSLGQAFDGIEPSALLGAPTALLTCWGDGRINARRASEAALRLALSPPWTDLDISRLIEARRAMFGPDAAPAAPTPGGQPLDPVARLLQTAQIRSGGAGITLDSTCHSLWIVTRNERRQWYDLAVEDRSDPNEPRTWTFSW
jgi:hypothetical protein